MSLLTKLNKPIPSLDPVIIQPEPKREVNPTLRACPVKNGEEFIGSAKLVTSAMYGMEIRGETVDGQQKEITGAIVSSSNANDTYKIKIGDRFVYLIPIKSYLFLWQSVPCLFNML